MYKWLRHQKYVSSLYEFRRLTLPQIKLFTETSKKIEEFEKVRSQIKKENKARPTSPRSR